MEQLNNQKWLFGQNAFVIPEDLGMHYPSFFDALLPDEKYLQQGILNKEDLEVKDLEGGITIKPGQYALKRFIMSLYPSESVQQYFPAGSSLLLGFAPSGKFKPTLSTFTYSSEGIIIPSETWIYSPYDTFTDEEKRFKFEISAEGAYTVKTNASVSIRRENESLFTKVITDDYFAYMLPEFPAFDLTADVEVSALDSLRGILYTTEDVSSVTVTYSVKPLFTYVPKDSVTEDIFFFEGELEEKKFLVLSAKPL